MRFETRTIVGAISVAVAVLAAMVVMRPGLVAQQTEEPQLPANQDYFLTEAGRVFDGQLAGAVPLAYAETKSAYSSDLHAAALFDADAVAGIAGDAPDEMTLLRFGRLFTDLPGLGLRDDLAPAAVARTGLASGSGEFALYLLEDGRALLELREY